MANLASSSQSRKNHAFMAGCVTIGVVMFMIAAKAYAYYMSGAASVLSSLTDSTLDSLTSIMALGSVYYASRPADAEHRWGHGKMEAVSALFQASVIFGGSIFLFFESLDRFYNPHLITHHMIGVYVMVFSIVVTALLVTYQRYALRHSESLAIETDSLHYSSDIVIHTGVLLVLLVEYYGAPLWIDPLFALCVAGFLGYLSRGIALRSLAMLLDREIPEAERQAIIDVIEGHDKVLGWHDLRTRKNGTHYVVSFDIESDGDQTLTVAHQIALDLEESILALYPDSEVMIHIDPHGLAEDCSRHRIKGVHY